MAGIWGGLMLVLGVVIGLTGGWLVVEAVSSPALVERGMTVDAISFALGLIILALGGILSMLGALGMTLSDTAWTVSKARKEANKRFEDAQLSQSDSRAREASL